MAVIIPAKSHPEVVIAAIAARNKTQAVAYAKSTKFQLCIALIKVCEFSRLESITFTVLQLCSKTHQSMQYTYHCRMASTTNGRFELSALGNMFCSKNLRRQMQSKRRHFSTSIPRFPVQRVQSFSRPSITASIPLGNFSCLLYHHQTSPVFTLP